jgi:hypothetical protein
VDAYLWQPIDRFVRFSDLCELHPETRSQREYLREGFPGLYLRSRRSFFKSINHFGILFGMLWTGADMGKAQ